MQPLTIAMKIYQRILLIWAAYVAFYALAALRAAVEVLLFTHGVTLGASALAAIVSFYVFKKETERRNRAVFLNFALFFGINATLYPIYLLVQEPLLRWDRFAGVYFSQYYAAQYFFFLPLCVIYIVLDSILWNSKPIHKYLLTVAIVGSLWFYLFYPYFVNPRYLYSTPDVLDYKAIDGALQELRNAGKTNPTLQEISSLATLYVREGSKIAGELVGREKERRVTELLPYMEGRNYAPLLFKPLSLSRFYMSLLCIAAIVFFIVYHYKHDPPKGAYLEKAVLLFLPYCCFEALHYFVFATLQSNENYLAAIVLGEYFSVAVMLLLVLVFGTRLAFVLSAEGKFYERHVLTDSSHITRWRDVIDNWIVRKFMNPEILERRFLIQRKKGL